MDTLISILKTRSSIRKYKTDHVDRSLILKCVEAARLSPSACNIQPWEFVIIDDAELKRKVSDQAFDGIYSQNKFAKLAPVLVVVLAHPDLATSKVAKCIHGDKYYLIDIGIACSNFILQAHELGLGCCLLGWFDIIAIKKIMQLSEDMIVACMLTLGYPEFDKLEIKNRKNINEIIKFNGHK